MDQQSLLANIFSDTLAHYQYLGIATITASIWLLKSSKGNLWSMIFSSLTVVILIFYLVFGLCIYREMIFQYSYLMDVEGASKMSLSTINRYILYQSWIGLFALLSLILSFIFYMRKKD